METIPRTLIDILSPDREPANVQKIIIPIIQRDYAQGRTDPGTTWIRKRLLDAMLHAVKEKEPMTLDFIYGDVDANGVMTPLDGQQRLTTLFLLYWYAAKKEEKDCAFLKNFGYTARPAAQDFCSCLLNFTPNFELPPDSEAPEPPISGKIANQAWFQPEWKKDPTVSSMLVMLDAIEQRFGDVQGLWKALAEKPAIITFYFLPIRDMGLTDALYLKMNSRGKPLNTFEQFKAELERELRKLDEKLGLRKPDETLAQRIISKIDHEWTDLLWSRNRDRSDDPDDPDDLDDLIGNEFLQYFKFICDILYCDSLYRQKMQAQEGTGMQTEPESFQNRDRDVFYLLKRFFAASCPDAKRNILLLEKYFDCWCNIPVYGTPDAFLASFISETHEPGKILVAPDMFKELLHPYDAETGQDKPFPVSRMLLLYAFITYLRYLRHQEEIAEPDFRRRIRIVNNLIRNSEAEIKKQDRIPEMLGTIYSIIRGKGSGKNSSERSGEEAGNPFNDGQMQEEREKAEYLERHPDAEKLLSRLEDHPMLHGQISIVLLNHSSKIAGRLARETNPYADWFVSDTKLITKYTERFEALFPCNECEHRHNRNNCHQCQMRDCWDKLDRALMALEDYSQPVGNEGYYQFASGNNPAVLDNLFHRSSDKGVAYAGRSLIALLERKEVRDFTNQYQKSIAKFTAKTQYYTNKEWVNKKRENKEKKLCKKLNDILDKIANKYLKKCEDRHRFPWQYYYVAYKEFRQAKYGKMYNPNKKENPYLFTVLSAKQQLSEKSYIPELRHIEPRSIEGKYKHKKDPNGTMLQWHEYKSLGCCITCTNNTYEIHKIGEDGSPGDFVDKVTIHQKDGIDTENRIEKLRNYLKEHGFPKRIDLIQNSQKQ